LTQITLRAANCAVDQGDPPADMNQAITALTAMQATSWVYPSEDATGATDLANINASLAANNAAYFAPGTYYINAAVTLTNGAILQGASEGGFGGSFPPGITEILLVNGSNSSMFLAPSTANYWHLRNLCLSANGAGQSGPTQTGSTGAAIHVEDAGAAAELQAEMDSVYIASAYNDALYLGVNRRDLHARNCKFMASGTNNATYGAGNGVTCNFSDHTFDACTFGTNNHHGIWMAPNNASSIRVIACDLFENGQDWANITPTTVAAGSNGQAVSGLTAAGVLNVASTAGFPAAGSLWINLSTGPVTVSYTGTSGGNQFTGVVVKTAQGNSGGTLATSQGVYIFGGNAVHLGTNTAAITVEAGNSMDRNLGCGVFTETAVNDIKVIGNRFVSNGQALTGLLPHVELISPNAQVSLVGNGMEAVISGFTAQCTYFVYSNGGGTWLDIANAFLSAQLSTGLYTNSTTGLSPFGGGQFVVQATATNRVPSVFKGTSGQTADLSQWQNSGGTVLANVTSAGVGTFPTVSVSGLTGATAGCRLVGAIASGTAPSTGTFLTGDLAVVQTGSLIVCTSGGSPGTWTVVS
jgi:hypothetical protein